MNLSDYRKEVQSLVSKANKRLARLEKNELTDTSAYKVWKNSGAEKFSTKGKKTYNDLQKEYFRVQRFLDDKTSTVRGANKVLKEIAKNTGIKYKNMKDLKKKSRAFFKLYDKLQDFVDNSDRTFKVNYKEVWKMITVAEENGIIKLGKDSIDKDLNILTNFYSENEKAYDTIEAYAYDKGLKDSSVLDKAKNELEKRGSGITDNIIDNYIKIIDNMIKEEKRNKGKNVNINNDGFIDL